MTPRVQGGLKTATAPTTAPPTISDRDVNRVLALCAGIAILTGPRRTRPLAGFLYGAYLSRVQGARYRRLEATLLGLFDQRRSVTVRVDDLEARVEAIAARVDVSPGRRRSGPAAVMWSPPGSPPEERL